MTQKKRKTIGIKIVEVRVWVRKADALIGTMIKLRSGKIYWHSNVITYRVYNSRAFEDLGEL